jgi:acetate kinase
VFSGGIGENSVACAPPSAAMPPGWACGWTQPPMPQRRGVRRISAADSKVAVWVVPANEELMIAQHALQLVEAP